MNNVRSAGVPPNNDLDQYDITESIVETIAERDDISPLDVTPPLATVIDPEALEQLVASLDARSDALSGAIVFSYSGYEVTVKADGTVSASE